MKHSNDSKDKYQDRYQDTFYVFHHTWLLIKTITYLYRLKNDVKIAHAQVLRWISEGKYD
jgi:hypothetical protein